MNSLRWVKSFCERGQSCSCWFDGWWKGACDKHDRRYKQKGMWKLWADLLLFWDVTWSVWWLCIPGFIMGLIMFVGLSVGGFWSWSEHKVERDYEKGDYSE